MKLEDVNVLDNIIPKSFADEIEKTLTGPNFSWTLIDDLGLNTYGANKKMKDLGKPHKIYYGFNHQFLVMGGKIVCPTYHLIKSIPYFALKSLGIEDEMVILRARSNIHLPNLLTKEGDHEGIHVDIPTQKHFVCLYYVNDSDGDTLIFSKKRNGNDYGEVTQRVAPKKGRVIIFNGNIFHCGTLPKENVRIVINFNLDPQKNEYFLP